jgi:erythritol transport system ATP-binding protein
MELSDRIIVMSNGRVTGDLPRSQATEEKVVQLSAAGHVPHKTIPSALETRA